MSNVYLRELLNPDGSCYSICGFCNCQIPKMENARWVDMGSKWPQLSCAECADAHPGESWDVVVPADVLEIVDCTAQINTLHDEMSALEKRKVDAIRKILYDEGYLHGMTIYHRGKPYVTKELVVHRYRHDTIKVVMHPAKKDGSSSKQHKSEMMWNQFLKLWRMQRADVSGYIDRCEKRDRESLERAKQRKLKDSDL